MKRIFALLLLLGLLCSIFSSCDMSYVDGGGWGGIVGDGSVGKGEDGNAENDGDDNTSSDEGTTQLPETEAPTEPPVKGPVLSHTYVLSGPYDVKGGYISGTESPSVSLSLSEIFDLEMLEEQNFLCRMTVAYDAAVQGDHLNLRFSMAVGGVFVLVDDYRYLNHDQTATQNHGVYSLSSDVYNRTGSMNLTWDTKGITGFDGLNHCRISNVSVYVEFYTDDPQVNQPEENLITEYAFDLSGSYTVRGGYISGTTTPSVSVDLGEVFDLHALAEKGYYCDIYVSYTAEVQGDHLNIRSTLDGPVVSVADYTFLEDNEKGNLGHSANNISSAYYATFTTLHIKWDCKGITSFDGLNECIVSNVRVDVVFRGGQ